MGFSSSESLKPLEALDFPESFKKKPEWMKCVVVTSLLISITLSAVAIGILIGYTFCYIENRTTHRMPGNITHSNHFQIVTFPLRNYEVGARNRTLHGASRVFMTRIFRMEPSHLSENIPLVDIRPREA